MFLTSGGGGGRVAWKTDSAEVYLFILQARQRNKNKAGEKTGWKLEVASVRVRGVGPAVLWVDVRTRPPR